MSNQKQLEYIFYYASYTLQEYIKKKFDVDINDVYDKIPVEQPFIIKNDIKFGLSVVSKDYVHDLPDDYNVDITFLINAVNTMFETFKITLEKNETKILQPFNFILDKNNNLCFNENDDIKIGVIRHQDN